MTFSCSLVSCVVHAVAAVGPSLVLLLLWALGLAWVGLGPVMGGWPGPGLASCWLSRFCCWCLSACAYHLLALPTAMEHFRRSGVVAVGGCGWWAWVLDAE